MDFSGYSRPDQSAPGGVEGRDLSSTEPGGDEDLAQLLFDVGQGNQESFSLFYDRTVRRVFGLAHRILIDTELSEDATQEVYLQVWKTAGQYHRAAGSPMAWLMTIAHRRAVDKVRSQQRSSDREARYLAASGDVERDDVVDSVTGRLEAEAVVQCLDTLTGRQQESVKLAYYGGLTYRQVAEKLGAAVPTVKSRIRDGLLRLRNCLEVS
ncbi:ECF RNA polymerase sigma factor SigK [Arthrobacter castelli]|uniref:ECF RNA polymerase sigma factor SigK n=1 Tax=Arthrobacter castelli TaxID=271431 RepID=UPI000409FF87|nr:ECF RNA polymerase sigma factor SigK [Arthrobacter castelli]